MLKTLSVRHQRYMCLQLSQPESFLMKPVTSGKGWLNHCLHNHTLYDYYIYIIAIKTTAESLDENSLIMQTYPDIKFDTVYKLVSLL